MALRRRVPARHIVLRAICGCLVALAPAICCGQPPADPEAFGAAMAAADAAALARDYQTSLDRLHQAAAIAPADLVPLIQRRRALYESYLAMDGLLALAQDNEGRLVGIAATRGGRRLAGLVQLFELGVTPGAAVGNRMPDKGRLLLRLADGSTRSVPGDQIARLQVHWLPPDRAAGRLLWAIDSLRVTLQSGEEFVGTPTWVMCHGSMSFRPAGAEEDTDIAALPPLGREFDPDDLAAELVVLGAPPGPRPAGEIGDAEEAAAAAPGGPAYSPPAGPGETPSVGSAAGEPDASDDQDRCPPAGPAQTPAEEPENE